MNLRQLQCFRAVMVAGSMTRAAEILGISQPAVSNLIAGLEHELGFALFRRTRGRLRPSPEASYFYDEAVRVLDSVDHAAQTAREIRRSNQGRIVIVSYPGISIDFLPSVIAEFRRERDQVQFRLLARSSDVVRDLLPAQQFDLGILESPADHPAVRSEAMTFRCRCVLPSGDPLAAKTVVTPEDLDGRPFVSLFKEHMTYHQLVAAFARAGARLDVVAECQYFATVCAFVMHRAGVGIADPFTAAAYAARGLVVRPFEPALRYDLALIQPADRITTRLVETFVALLKARLAPYLDAPSRAPGAAQAPAANPA